jgi:hypothetical protein
VCCRVSYLVVLVWLGRKDMKHLGCAIHHCSSSQGGEPVREAGAPTGVTGA